MIEGAKPTPAAASGRPRNGRSLIARKRFQFAGAMVIGAILPYLIRTLILPAAAFDPPNVNAMLGNGAAIMFAFWMRLSIITYPGIRSSYVLLPTALAAHGLIILFFLLSRLPYDRLALTGGFLLHVLWLYLTWFIAERRVRQKIAIVPIGQAGSLTAIPGVDWLVMKRPRLADTARCDAIVADFAADMPDEWEAFLADAALAGRMVYQVKQLSESLTGRVELQHLSENSFGSLLPARGYFHLKALADFLLATLILPPALLVMAAAALAIKLEDGGEVLFRQKRVGHAGKRIIVYKFRTMRPVEMEDERHAAMTAEKDQRVTRVGRFLRRTRIDELPQMLNILKWQMSWIGPRPEAEVLSLWYTSELPFYRYRHVVKPGISGWAQVNQGHVAGVDEVNEKLQYDFYYIKYFSPWLDILILLRTIKTVLSGFGAR